MKSILVFLSVAMAHMARADTGNPCYQGRFSILANGGKIIVDMKIKDNFLTAKVANPDEPLKVRGGGTKTAKELLDPGPGDKLVPMTGLKCPTCMAYQTENGHFTIVSEHLEDGSVRTTMNYFGMYQGIVDLQKCSEDSGTPLENPSGPQTGK